MALAEKDFINEVYKMNCSVDTSQFLSQVISVITNKIMKKVAIMAGMEVRLGFSSVDFHLPRLNWLQQLLSTQLASSRDQH